jgi:hypothetical protein
MVFNVVDSTISWDEIVLMVLTSIMISFGRGHIDDEIIYQGSSSSNNCLNASVIDMGGMIVTYPARGKS